MRYVILTSIIALIILGSVMCTTTQPAATAPIAELPDGKAFAGAAACQTCHRKIYQDTRHTAHFLTSSLPDAAHIKGSFAYGKNTFTYSNNMEVVMNRIGNKFYQTGFVNGTIIQREAFGMVIGSGRMGQTYLYWADNHLFQLPVSYFTPIRDWANSPGYAISYIRFNRPVPANCIECHGTYAAAQILPDNSTIYNRQKIIYGVDCERCHGPGAAHVAYHTAHPADTVPQYIVSTAHMDRQLKLDACALCHSGIRNLLQPAFSYQVGQHLEEYSTERTTAGELDVHGNQYGLLTASKCFRMSQMDCGSCHDVHQDEAKNPGLFSKRCMNCHSKNDTCRFRPENGLVLSENCIDCHMPAMASAKITFKMERDKAAIPDLVRTHRVGIYLEETKAFVKGLQ
ncbi:multiheme c-type cytochrome [Chitinophaga sp.]|uniref:multiheme c-type cytochrome n=1 Tax=Chitinophaga sp. TaxID=1869181 RepID=UPI0031DEC33E